MPTAEPKLTDDLDEAGKRLAEMGDVALGARLRAHAARIRAEMAALEIRSKDKRDPLTDHAFCALNALTRVNSPLAAVSRG